MHAPPVVGSPPSISLIVPTFREAANLPWLVERIAAVREQYGLELELWIIDDDSRDGAAEWAAELPLDWVHFVVRRGERGLSSAVLDGFARARNDVLIVMDADLSHPPEAIPELLAALEAGADFVIGSRYVAGGSTDAAWGLARWLNSKAATLLARPFTSARDPMAGFFAFRRRTLDRAAALNPVGYKIGLELIVKCGCNDVREIPIAFADRRHGESKLTLGEQLRYLKHLRRLLIFKYPNGASAVQFGLVGASGVAVNLAVVTFAQAALGAPAHAALAAGIAISVVTNFLLNRRFTFAHARDGNFVWQLLGYTAACSVGLAVNYAAAVATLDHLLPDPWRVTQLAALVGIAAGTLFDYVISRYLVFRAPRRPLTSESSAPTVWEETVVPSSANVPSGEA